MQARDSVCVCVCVCVCVYVVCSVEGAAKQLAKMEVGNHYCIYGKPLNL